MDPEVVVCWFGTELFVAAEGELQAFELPEKGDEVGAVVRAIDRIAPKPGSIRMIYHPADLEMHAAECVKAGRAVLRSTLGEDFPALRNPATAWAISRLHPTDVGQATLLWIDVKPRLGRLRAALASRGIRLTGAWPLTSLLEITPPTDRVGQPVLALVVTDSGGLVYAVTPGGARTVVWCVGSEHRGQLSGMVRNTLAHYDEHEPPAVLVVGGGAEPIDLGVTPLAGLQPSTISLSQLVERGVDLDRRDPANFLPPDPRLTANAAVWAAAAACLVLALVNAGLYGREYRRVQHDVALRQQIARTLQAGNARLVGNQRKIEALQSLESEMEVAGNGRLQLLAAIMRDKPVEVTIHAITINGRGFEIAGTAHEGVGQSRGPFYRFIDALGAKTHPWQINSASRPPHLSTDRFTITGSFR